MTTEDLAIKITATALIILAIWLFKVSWTVSEHAHRHDECEQRAIDHTRRHIHKGL